MWLLSKRKIKTWEKTLSLSAFEVIEMEECDPVPAYVNLRWVLEKPKCDWKLNNKSPHFSNKKLELQ